MAITRVAVAGALGRMGRLAALHLRSTPDVELVAAIVRARPPGGDVPAELAGIPIFEDATLAYETARPDVVVDLSVAPASVALSRAAVECGISPVIGATGWTSADEAAFAELCASRRVPAAIVPNFALGAVLAIKFAAEAARYFPTVEIVELHHDRKKDAPSGTARLTGRRIAAARAAAGLPLASEFAGAVAATGDTATGVTIHSVRLRGLVAHQEVLFGGEGEVLTIRHDSLDRSSFMAGIALAVRAVRSRTGLVVGLESLMEEAS